MRKFEVIKENRAGMTVLLVFIACLSIFGLSTARAQQYASGLPVNGEFTVSKFDTINSVDQNLRIPITLVSRPNRVGTYSFGISYNHMNWYTGWPMFNMPTGDWFMVPYGSPWQENYSPAPGSVQWNAFEMQCNPGDWGYWVYNDPVFVDANGTSHPFTMYIDDEIDSTCGYWMEHPQPRTVVSDGGDQSGYQLIETTDITYGIGTTIVEDASGNSYGDVGTYNFLDRNGNSPAGTIDVGPYSNDPTQPVYYQDATNSLSYTAAMVWPPGVDPEMLGAYNFDNFLNSDYTYPVQGGGSAQFHTRSSVHTIQRPCTTSVWTFPMFLLDSIALADGTSYVFQYDAFGRMSQATLPTGAVYQYSYDTGESVTGMTCPMSETRATSRMVNGQPAGSVASVVSGGHQTVTIVDPNGFQTARTFEPVNVPIPYAQVDTNATTIKKVCSPVGHSVNQFCDNAPSPTTPDLSNPYRFGQVTQYISREDGSISTTIEADLADTKMPTDVWTWGYDNTNFLVPDRWIHNSYDTTTRPILLTEKQVYDHGTLFSDEKYYYDQASLTPSVSPNLYTPVVSRRGNLTEVDDWVSGNQWISQYKTYYDNGLVHAETDGNGNTTTYTYGNCGNSRLSAVSTPIYATSPMTWFCDLPQPASQTDVSGATTSYSYETLFNRLSRIDGPVPGSATVKTYNSAAKTVETRVRQDLSSSTSPGLGWTDEISVFDSLGQPSRSFTQVDAQNWYTVDQVYDIAGRIAFRSLPYYSTGTTSAKMTSGLGDVYSYDSSGRPSGITHTGGSLTTASSVTSFGRDTKYLDESGKGTIIRSDAFGNPSVVCELSGSNSTGCGLGISGSGFLTNYTYNALSLLTNANQLGSVGDTARIRMFQYDGLGRLVSATNPETGTTNNSYDGNGNMIAKTSPAPNGHSGTITLGYCYDQLNRLSYKLILTAQSALQCPAPSVPVTSYPNGTIAAFVYGGSGSAMNTVGRLTNAVTVDGGVVTSQISPLSYDEQGRVKLEQQCPIIMCATQYSFSYNYDYAGNLINSNNGLPSSSSSSLNQVYGFDIAGRLNKLTAAIAGAPSTTLFQATTYSAAGLTAAQLGLSPTGAAISVSKSYDERLRPVTEVDNGSIITAPATASSGTMIVSGIERPPTSATHGTATLQLTTIGNYIQICVSGYPASSCVNMIESSLPYSVVIDGIPITDVWGAPNALAFGTGMANAINASNASPVTASIIRISDSIGALTLTSKVSGSGTNYPFSIDINGSDLTCSVNTNYTLTGGADAIPADTGSIVLSMSNTNAPTVTWGPGDSATTVATNLAGAIFTAFGNAITPTVVGSGASVSIQLHSNQPGALTNYAINVNASGGPSFTVTPTTMSGGADPITAPAQIYAYDLTGKYAPNGNLNGYSDSVMGTWNFGYDALNRLTSGSAAIPGPGVTITSQSFCYDSFGNRWPGAPNTTCAQNFAPNNQLIAQGYDAAGNVTADINFGTGGNFYNYDVENRVTLVNDTIAYRYDAEGRRISKGILQSGTFLPTEFYLYDISGKPITELDGAGNWKHSNIFAGGRLLASNDANGIHYQLTDWLGSRRVQATGTGLLEESCVVLPFGDGPLCSGSDATELRFTGKERDAESGLDYFGARYYGSNAGRFISPDPSGMVYANPTNPQSFNLYSYVLNNPLVSVDPTGMECVWDDGSFDSQDDPDSGSHEKCYGLGGNWVDHDAFSTMTSSDWSSQPDSEIAMAALQINGSFSSISVNANGDASVIDQNYFQWSTVNTNLLYQQVISLPANPIKQLATGVMNFGIPKLCGIGYTGRIGLGGASMSAGASASGNGFGANAGGHSVGTQTAQNKGGKTSGDYRDFVPFGRHIPVGAVLTPTSDGGLALNSVSWDGDISVHIRRIKLSVGGTFYANIGTYTPNITDPQNCP